MHVIDGEWLLHQIKRTRGSNIKTIVATNIKAKFTDSNVVFDGYGIELTLKDHEHSGEWQGRKFLQICKLHQSFNYIV